MTGGPRRAGPRWTDLTDRDAPRPRRRDGRRRATAGGVGLMSILRLRGVTREVGTFVILDAIDAAIALGDRIGLVGPNGAGKTTLLRLAAGRDEPDRGRGRPQARPDHRAARPGGPPRRGRSWRRPTCAPRCGPARRISSGWPSRWPSSSATAGSTEPAYANAPARVRGPRRVHARPAGRQRAERARVRPRRVGEAADGDVRRRADARLAGPAGHRRPRPAAARRADEPPRHLGDRVARGPPAQARRVAAGRLPRPRLPRCDRGRGSGSCATGGSPPSAATTAPTTASASSAMRVPSRKRTRPPSRSRAERELVQRYRSHRKFSKMHEHEARLERLDRRAARGAEGRAGSWPSRPRPWPARGPSRSGEIVVRVEDLAVGYLPGRGALDAGRRRRPARRGPWRACRSSRPSAGSASASSGPNGAGKTTLLRTIAGDLPPLDGSLTFGHAVQLGYLAAAPRGGHPGRHGPRRAARGDPGHGRRGALVSRPLPVPRRRRR